MQFDPISMIVIFSSMAILPLAMMVTTSFLKISIVLLIVRNALGVQQVPPTMVIYAIALAITAYIMSPVLNDIKNQISEVDIKNAETSELVAHLEKGSEPLKNFIKRYASEDTSASFINLTKELWPEDMVEEANEDSFLILIPSFIISEIQSGFKIGFLIYLPLIAIDLLVSNLLLALGMQMVSPMTISMPLKILLFVIADGWEKLLHSLILGYL